ncbi:MAG: hypothetical protein WCD11_37285 [Solirubrobacteraceae bacterium]
MSERSPSAYPLYKPDPVRAWMAVAGSGLNPAEGDVGTADAPPAAPHASLATQPDEGRNTALGEGVAAADRCRHQIGG